VAVGSGLLAALRVDDLKFDVYAIGIGAPKLRAAIRSHPPSAAFHPRFLQAGFHFIQIPDLKTDMTDVPRLVVTLCPLKTFQIGLVTGVEKASDRVFIPQKAEGDFQTQHVTVKRNGLIKGAGGETNMS
jgi:hypothetical protein